MDFQATKSIAIFARIDRGEHVDVFEVLAYQGQPRMARQVVRQFLDNEVGHGEAHLQGGPHMEFKSLISIEKSTNHHAQVTDSGQ